MALSITCSSMYTFKFPCPFTFRSTFKGTFLLCTVTYVNVFSSILCSYNVSYHRCRALWWFFSGPSVTWGWRSAAVGLIGCKRLWTESLQQNHTTSDQTLIAKVKITPTERDRKIDGQEETDRGGDTERRKQRETKKTERQGHTHTHWQKVNLTVWTEVEIIEWVLFMSVCEEYSVIGEEVLQILNLQQIVACM